MHKMTIIGTLYLENWLSLLFQAGTCMQFQEVHFELQAIIDNSREMTSACMHQSKSLIEIQSQVNIQECSPQTVQLLRCYRTVASLYGVK